MFGNNQVDTAAVEGDPVRIHFNHTILIKKKTLNRFFRSLTLRIDVTPLRTFAMHTSILSYILYSHMFFQELKAACTCFNRGGSPRFRKWNYFSQKVHRFPDQGCNNAIETITRQKSLFHHQIMLCGSEFFYQSHTQSRGKMFPSIILDVYYMKNKKSGQRSENILVQKHRLTRD